MAWLKHLSLVESMWKTGQTPQKKTPEDAARICVYTLHQRKCTPTEPWIPHLSEKKLDAVSQRRSCKNQKKQKGWQHAEITRMQLADLMCSMWRMVELSQGMCAELENGVCNDEAEALQAQGFR